MNPQWPHKGEVPYLAIGMEYDPNPPPLCIWCADAPKTEGNLCRRCYDQAEMERQVAIRAAEDLRGRFSPGSVGHFVLDEELQRLLRTDPREYMLPKHSVLKEVGLTQRKDGQ